MAFKGFYLSSGYFLDFVSPRPHHGHLFVIVDSSMLYPLRQALQATFGCFLALVSAANDHAHSEMSSYQRLSFPSYVYLPLSEIKFNL